MMGRSITVLHVDPDQVVRDQVATHLPVEGENLNVTSVPTADEARDHLNETVIDCVLAEYHLTTTDGIEFLTTIRADHPHLPFILFTNETSQAVVNEAISAGITDYFHKGQTPHEYAIVAHRIDTAVTAYRATNEADRRRHRLAQILKTVPECVVQISYDGKFVYANERAKEVLGLEREAVSDRTYNDLEWKITDLDGNPIPDNQLPFRQVRDTGESVRGFRHNIEWPDGTNKTLLVNGAPLFDKDGIVESTVFALSDITEQEDREQELQRKNKRLNEFVNIVSHDLRNPLNVAKGRLELLEAECDSEHIDDIDRALDRSAELINELHALAREGEAVRDMERVNLDMMIESCWQNVATANASLVNHTAVDVLADPSRFRQLLENLFRNAVEHAGETVTVTVGRTSEETGFFVADDGPGLPQEIRDKAFESGFSTDPAGTGFGLAIVREIANAHDWKIDLTESESGGARFEITGVTIQDESA